MLGRTLVLATLWFLLVGWAARVQAGEQTVQGTVSAVQNYAVRLQESGNEEFRLGATSKLNGVSIQTVGELPGKKVSIRYATEGDGKSIRELEVLP